MKQMRCPCTKHLDQWGPHLGLKILYRIMCLARDSENSLSGVGVQKQKRLGYCTAKRPYFLRPDTGAECCFLNMEKKVERQMGSGVEKTTFFTTRSVALVETTMCGGEHPKKTRRRNPGKNWGYSLRGKKTTAVGQRACSRRSKRVKLGRGRQRSCVPSKKQKGLLWVETSNSLIQSQSKTRRKKKKKKS